MIFQPALKRINIANLFPQANQYLLQQFRFYPLIKMNKDSKWEMKKSRILNLPLDEKRKLYKSSDFVTLDKIETWASYAKKDKNAEQPSPEDLSEYKKYTFNAELNSKLAEKVSIFEGDITQLEIDAIVNAANSALRRGGGVDGAIHRAAGPLLQEECYSLKGCQTGDAKITGGYALPAKYVIHTVGPQDGSPSALQSCYEKSLAYHQLNKINSIAFPCISTGIYGFPNRPAAHIALSTTRKFLESNQDMERVIFCTFLPVDVEIYKTLMNLYFPCN